MNRILIYIRNNYSNIYKVFLIVLTIFAIIIILPKESKFKYEYIKGRPWSYETLIAQKDIPIIKDEETLKREASDLEKTVKPFFVILNDSQQVNMKIGLALFDTSWVQNFGFEDKVTYQKSKETYKSLVEKIYRVGVVPIKSRFKPGDLVYLVQNKEAVEQLYGDFLNAKTLKQFVKSDLNDEQGIYSSFVEAMILKTIKPNIAFDEKRTNKELNALIEDITPFEGKIQKGQLVISKGEMVTDHKVRLLHSFKADFNANSINSYFSVLIGQIILVAISLISFVLFLVFFRKDIYEESKHLVFMFFLMVIIVFMTRVAVHYNADYLFVVPLLLNIIIIRSFYDTRLALMVHLTIILFVSYIAPNSFQFLFLQLITGMITIITIVNLSKRSVFLLTSFWVFVSYSLMYSGMLLITEGDISHIDLTHIVYFAINSIFLLFAIPLIYLFEKLFGMVTHVSLLEYADTNSKLLRYLSSKAPGTFQHSVQVANLAEEAIREIGGDALLVRAGAMYHDIGKAKNAMYFTENQQGNYSPHEDLSFEESARIIIDHVIDGVELARKHNIPEQIIDFIRTHHGTKTVEYFYRMSLKDKPRDEVNLEEFTYKGPIPFSRETCVLMMADAVEAASRSIKDPDSKKISDLVDNIIKSQMEGGQYDNADMTLREINKVKNLLAKRLMSIYHVRIEYPDK